MECIRLGSVRSNHLPFTMHDVRSSLHVLHRWANSRDLKNMGVSDNFLRGNITYLANKNDGFFFFGNPLSVWVRR